MADIVNFPPPPSAEPSEEVAELRKHWGIVENTVHGINTILNSVNDLGELTDHQKFRLQWELECALMFVRGDAFSGQRLPADDYTRRRETLMRSLGLERFI